MKRTVGRFLTTVIALALGIANIKAQGNLLVNGDFETGDLSGWDVLGSAGSVVVDSDNVESGSYAAAFSVYGGFGFPPNRLELEQSHLPTIAGQSYLLTFWYAGPYGAPGGENPGELETDWNQDLLFSTSFGGPGYTEFSTTVTGTGDDNLTFYAWNYYPSEGVAYLDNVSLVATPEPTDLALLALGGGVLFSFRFARRKFRPLVAVVCVLLSLTLSVSASSTPPAAEYVPGDAIVTFKPSVNSTAAEQRLASHALVWKRHFAGLSHFRGRETGLVHANNRTAAALIAELKRDPNVETAELNYLYRPASAPPNDTYFTKQWNLQNTGQSIVGIPFTAGTPGDDIHFVKAWALAQPPSTNPPVVAVIDTGVDYGHPDLASNIWVNTAENPTNGLDNDGDGYTNDYYGYDFADDRPDPMDSSIHGTYMAGMIAAVGNNHLGIIGVDYQARIMALRASNDGSETLPQSAIIEAIQYATMMKERGVNVVAINASFGGGGYNSAMLAAIQDAGANGIIFCAAAMNNSSDNDTTPIYPASYRTFNEIVVAATDMNDSLVLASFSDYGPNTVDLGAPGYGILSLEPVAAVSQIGGLTFIQQGSNIYTASTLHDSGGNTGLTATIHDCGFGTPVDFPAGVSNYIALIRQGSLTLSNQVSNAMAAGARAVLFYISDYATFAFDLGSPGNWIPALFTSQADWLALQTNAPATIAMEPYAYDNGTSFSAAQVSGAVAFAAMNFPDETVSQRIQRILANVDVVPGLTGKVRTGGRLNLQRIVDTDGNGLPDWWEQDYFGHLTGTDPNADPDHDGLNNMAEWIAGTNPTNATSNLRLTLVSATNANGIELNWPSVAGKTYWLERSTNLLTGFGTVATNIAATAPTNTETDADVLPSSARFYRVGVEQ